MAEVLDRRSLNRAYLARQSLLERCDRDVPAMLEHLVGMQSQAPRAPYVGLWTRVRSFDPESLEDLMERRATVRLTLHRGTVHLVTARDCDALRPTVQPAITRLFAGTPHGKATTGAPVDQVIEEGRRILADGPLPNAELGKRLATRWPDYPPDALAYLVQMREPMVQVTPRGLWHRSARTAHTTAGHWLGGTRLPPCSIDDLVRRYLGAFGPASPADFRTWSGLTGVTEVFERIRSTLVVFRDPRGTELFDLPDAPRPGPSVPARPRFLPEFDNALLSHADRDRVISADDRRRLFTANGIVSGTFLVDGFVAGWWKPARSGETASLTLHPYRALPKRAVTALAAEGHRLLRFLHPTATTREVRC